MFLVFCVCSFDRVMQSLKNTARNTADDLSEVFTEMRGHLYMYAGHLLMKTARDQQQWRAVLDLAALCYLIAYQVPHNYITRFFAISINGE